MRALDTGDEVERPLTYLVKNGEDEEFRIPVEQLLKDMEERRRVVTEAALEEALAGEYLLAVNVNGVRACAEKLNFLSPFSLARKPSTIVDWHRDWKAAQEALKKRGAAINPAVSAAIAPFAPMLQDAYMGMGVRRTTWTEEEHILEAAAKVEEVAIRIEEEEEEEEEAMKKAEEEERKKAQGGKRRGSVKGGGKEGRKGRKSKEVSGDEKEEEAAAEEPAEDDPAWVDAAAAVDPENKRRMRFVAPAAAGATVPSHSATETEEDDEVAPLTSSGKTPTRRRPPRPKTCHSPQPVRAPRPSPALGVPKSGKIKIEDWWDMGKQFNLTQPGIGDQRALSQADIDNLLPESVRDELMKEDGEISFDVFMEGLVMVSAAKFDGQPLPRAVQKLLVENVQGGMNEDGSAPAETWNDELRDELRTATCREELRRLGKPLRELYKYWMAADVNDQRADMLSCKEAINLLQKAAIIGNKLSVVQVKAACMLTLYSSPNILFRNEHEDEHLVFGDYVELMARCAQMYFTKEFKEAELHEKVKVLIEHAHQTTHISGMLGPLREPKLADYRKKNDPKEKSGKKSKAAAAKGAGKRRGSISK